MFVLNLDLRPKSNFIFLESVNKIVCFDLTFLNKDKDREKDRLKQYLKFVK